MQQTLPKVMKRRASKIFILVFSVVCVALSVVVANLLSSALTVSGGMNLATSFNNFSVYCISLGEYTSISQANSKADESMKKGSGGFVYKKDNLYYVLASAYEKENDAKLVSENLAESGITNKILVIKINKPPLEEVSDENQQKNFYQALFQLKTSYLNLYDISVSLDTNSLDETKAKIETIGVKGELEKVLQKTNRGNSSIDGIYYQMIKNTYNEIEELLESLKDYENINGITLSAKIKNVYLNIIEKIEKLIELLNNEI